MEYKVEELELSELSKYKNIDKFIPCILDPKTNMIIKFKIPNEKLSGLTKIKISSTKDIDKIPSDGGNYWILTNEPVNHCLNSGKCIPEKTDDGYKVVYNGVSDNLQLRVSQHLLRKDINGSFGSQSGISVDILKKEAIKTISHVKCAWTSKVRKKIPKIISSDNKISKPKNKQIMMESLNLTDEEKKFCDHNEDIYFKNGINVADNKHKNYNWFFVFAKIPTHNIRDYIEQEWRKIYGVPILCSYVCGR